MSEKLIQRPELHNKNRVFDDRREAGRVLAKMLAPVYEADPSALVLAIPSGGVPVGLEISRALSLPMDLVVVRKVQIPDNPEAGFGALTLEGEVFINQDLLTRLRLTQDQVDRQIAKVRRELEERNKVFRGGRAFPDLSGKTALVCDDGLASGFTMLACIHTARQKGADKIVVAVPTAPLSSIYRVSPLADEIYCANVQDFGPFAVASAYRRWRDLEQDEVVAMLERRELLT